MTTYKEIKGTQIEAVSSDPSNPVEGQVWYNTTSNVLKGQAATAAGAWVTGNNTNTQRTNGASFGVSKDSSIMFGGGDASGSLANVESYNGTNWTEVNDINQARQNVMGAGIQTSGLAFGGLSNPPVVMRALTESWNGTNWTEVADLNTTRAYAGNSGVSNTSALAFAGDTNATNAVTAVTELYNGTNWTEVNDVNTARSRIGSNGTQTSALMYAGRASPGTSPPFTATTESWNGTNWTEVNDVNTVRQEPGEAGSDNTDALCFGGETAPGTVIANNELWNGTNWTETTNLNTARQQIAGNGTASSAIAVAGAPFPSVSRATEEFTGAGAGLTRTFTDS